MSDEIASISLKVNSGEVASANTTLDEFAKSAEKAEKANDKLGDSAQKAGAKVKQQKTDMAGVSEAADKQATSGAKLNKEYDKQAVLSDKLGMSQKALANQMRILPAQFSDIVVSLQGGQRPLTVLLQQGSQIKDSFGGVGNALRAMAAYIGPVGLAIGAIGSSLAVVGAVFTRTDRQMNDLNKTLNLTSHYSGLTTNEILKLGEASEKSGGSFSKTVDVVKALAAAGVSAAADFGGLSKAVQDFAKASGQPVEALVAQVAKLSTDPVGGLQALQAQYHNVTTEQIQHIEKLVEQGDKSRAVAEANNVASQSFVTLARTTTENLGYMERAMNSVKSAAKGMWESILDIGRAESLDSKLADANKSLAISQKRWDLEKNSKFLSEESKNALYSEMVARQEAVNLLQKQADAANKTQEETKKTAVASLDSADAATRLNETLKAQITTEEKLRATRAALLSDMGKYPEKAEQYKKAIAGVDKQLKEIEDREAKKNKKTIKVGAGIRQDESSQAEVLALQAQIELIKQRNTLDRNASSQRKEYLLFEAQHQVLVEAGTKRQLTLAEKQTLASYEKVKANKAQVAELGDELALLQRQAQAHDQIAKQVADINAQIETLTASYGLSTREAERLAEANRAAAKARSEGATEKDVAAQSDAMNKLWDAQDARSKDWASGAITGLKDWADAASNYGAIASDAIKSAMSKSSQALSDFVTTGKLDFKSFAADILKMIADIITQLLVANAVKTTLGAFGLGGMLANADGGAYAGGNLSAYSGTIVDKPTLFNFGSIPKFANGAGLMGEAGAEAILPLKRGADGKLGVSTDGSAGGANVSTAITVNVTSSGATSSTTSNGDALGRAIGDQLKSVVATEVQRMMQPGGAIYKFQRG